MKSIYFRLTALTLTLLLCFSLYAISDLNPSSANAAGNIIVDGVDIGFAPNDYFTKDGNSCYNTYWPYKRCHKNDVCIPAVHPECNCMRHWPVGDGTTVDLDGSQCYGYAHYIQWKLYGCHDSSHPDEFNTVIGYTTGISASDEDWLQNQFYGLAPGSHIRMGSTNEHSQIIMSTNADGITVTECNTDGYCKITTKYYTWSELGAEIANHNGVLQFVTTNIHANYTPDTTPPVVTNTYSHAVSDSVFRVVADIQDVSDMDTVVFYVWHDGMEGSIAYDGVYNGDHSWFMDVDIADFGSPTDTVFHCHAYAYDYTGNLTKIAVPDMPIGSTSAPVPTVTPLKITSVYYQGVTSDGFRIVADIPENTDLVHNVTFNIKYEGMSGWIPYEGVFNGDHSWFMDVSLSDFGNKTSVEYIAHVYAYDAAGNDYGVVADNLYIEGAIAEGENPISSVYYQGVTTEGFRVVADIPEYADEIERVVFYIMYEGMGQWFDYEGVFNGDHSWFMDVSLSDFNSATNITYITHAYAYDSNNTPYAAEAPDLYIDAAPPTISDITISNMSPAGYRISAKVTDMSQISRVLFPTWPSTGTCAADQWLEGKTSGGDIWYVDVKLSNYENVAGTKLRTHVYAYDSWNNYSRKSAGDTYVDGTAPVISIITASRVESQKFTVSALVSDNVEVDHVRITIWDAEAESPAIHAVNAQPVNNSWKAEFNLIALNMHSTNLCSYQIFAYDTAGNMVSSTPRTFSIIVSEPSAAVNLPDSISMIDGMSFSGNSSISSLLIPDGNNVSIGSSAFSNCTDLSTVIMHDNVVDIDETAFDGCSGITFYCPRDSYAMYYAISHGIPYCLTA